MIGKFSRFVPLLFLGLALRLIMMVVLEPFVQTEWFEPFFIHFFTYPSLDPWTNFLNMPANNHIFPYGIIMFLFLTPFVGLMIGVAHVTGIISVDFATGFGIKLGLITADFFCFWLLWKFFSYTKTYIYIQNNRRLIWLYWFSPIVLGATYWTGQLDIIPVSILLSSIIAVKQRQFFLSGILLVSAISAKFSMALALPFLILYFLHNTRMKQCAISFFYGCIFSAFPLLILPLFSRGYCLMVFGTEETGRLFDMSFFVGDAAIYITPVSLLLVLYAAWRLAYMSFDLLTAFLALATLLIVLTTATPPGWYLWFLPFLLLHLVPAEQYQRCLGSLFSFAVFGCQVLFWPPPLVLGQNIFMLPLAQDTFLYSLWLTAIFSMGCVLLAGILRNSFYRNELYRFGLRPISIAIAGDSGSGKDTLASSLIHLFGVSSTVHISGDDYHFWDRKGALWKVMTHLNPRANDLKRFYTDINAILDKKCITYRKYQHTNGRFSSPVRMQSRNFCIVSGLHVLLQKALCSRFDIRIFLEMEESLRIFFKCQRDSYERGYKWEEVEAAIDYRKFDAKRYISPQRSQADIIFSLGVLQQEQICCDTNIVPVLYLTVRLRHALYYEELARQLVALCGLHVDLNFTDDMEEVVIQIEGDIRAEDIAMLALESIPELEELLAVKPKWQSGIQGIMQLVILYQLLQTLRINR